MEEMKKFISFLLMIIMVFSMAVSVFATSEPMMTPEKSRSIMQWRGRPIRSISFWYWKALTRWKKHMLIKQFQPGRTGWEARRLIWVLTAGGDMWAGKRMRIRQPLPNWLWQKQKSWKNRSGKSGGIRKNHPYFQNSNREHGSFWQSEPWLLSGRHDPWYPLFPGYHGKRSDDSREERRTYGR